MSLILATVAGGALAASLPPRGWWPVGLFGFLVLGGALQDTPPRARASVGLVAGLALMVPGLWWAADLHAVGAAVLMVVEASMFAVVGLLVSPKRPWLSLPAAVVIIEAVRWRWPFGGLPLRQPRPGAGRCPLAPDRALGRLPRRAVGVGPPRGDARRGVHRHTTVAHLAAVRSPAGGCGGPLAGSVGWSQQTD